MEQVGVSVFRVRYSYTEGKTIKDYPKWVMHAGERRQWVACPLLSPCVQPGQPSALVDEDWCSGSPQAWHTLTTATPFSRKGCGNGGACPPSPTRRRPLTEMGKHAVHGATRCRNLRNLAHVAFQRLHTRAHFHA